MVKRYPDYVLGFSIAAALILIDALGGTPLFQGLLGLAWALMLGFGVGAFLLAIGLMAWHR
ncbi:hypothetical protein [Methylomonas rapida]|uniref:DUF4175 domain-containing protein n=1 Tax=Methylomonas rapida TaxID=2963939 RepID=A0ABY7GCD0_9GAMM|nr:hypothetical protein [Methylomonas rapida]WAR42937.1 hypothetical protein NM686_011035 [Methylomonas rapida]